MPTVNVNPLVVLITEHCFFFHNGNTQQEKFLNAKYNGRHGNLFNKENLIKTTTECTTQTAFEYKVEKGENVVFILNDLLKRKIPVVKCLQPDGSS